MNDDFPGIGRRYRVDFGAFRVELAFASATSLTYYNLDRDDQRVGSETVRVAIAPIADGIFLVVWQEWDKTTVVHVEDYNRRTIVTNITGADLSFSQAHGTFRELP